MWGLTKLWMLIGLLVAAISTVALLLISSLYLPSWTSPEAWEQLLGEAKPEGLFSEDLGELYDEDGGELFDEDDDLSARGKDAVASNSARTARDSQRFHRNRWNELGPRRNSSGASFDATNATAAIADGVAADRRQMGRHCVVHIHGIHFTGTGYARDTVYRGLGEDVASKMQQTGVPEDEGQHLQDVYSKFFRRRNSSVCGTIDSRGRRYPLLPATRYYCPGMLAIANQSDARERLWLQWSSYWDLRKTFLIQKTPTMDVLFLEKMKVERTFHLIVMRHPFNNFMVRRSSCQMSRKPLLFWLDIWSYLLGQLALGAVESYAVVQYEAMIRSEDRFPTVIASSIRAGCSMDSIEERRDQHGRRLNLHKGNSSKYFTPSRKAIARQKICMDDFKCQDLMVDLEPVVSHFGYSLWNLTDFRPEGMGSQGLADSMLVLFSQQKPPSQELASKMRSLVEKYTVQ